MDEPLWALPVYFAFVVLFVAETISLSYPLGQRHRDGETGEPYESGVLPTGSAHVRLDVRFYLVALFFVVFDLGTAFIFAWAISFREAGWNGFLAVSVFAGILLTALVYLWRVGALDWTRPVQRPTRPAARAGTAERSQPGHEVVAQQTDRSTSTDW